MRRVSTALLAAGLLLAAAGEARADATLFLGANTTPDTRMVRGVSIGTGLAVFGFEFEYATNSGDTDVGAPSLKVGSLNGLLQAPFEIHGFQPYVTAGAGIYRERLGSRTDTGVAPNLGGGLKIALSGPIRLRVDYRVFRLGHGALYTPAHRVYAGVNLRF
ncbi:MAG: outer membrane protein [Vicinamibacterales bacterium]